MLKKTNQFKESTEIPQFFSNLLINKDENEHANLQKNIQKYVFEKAESFN